ncbi:MAG: OsmC family protein [Gammaproteobacteria bacterium]|nr:OsmC family protein [Gammaproteobacteria bacterium]
MSEERKFTIELDQQDGYEFKVNFNLQGVEDLMVDETPPVGQGKGPNPSRMLAVAAANCLSASLLFCVTKNAPPGGSLHTRATCTLTRNAGGRLRIGNIHVTLKVNGELEEAARMKRCLDLFEDFCVVTASLREGFPIDVEVVGEAGQRLYSSSGA